MRITRRWISQARAGYVEDVESLRVHLGLEVLTLYGHSHGGCVALAYAQRSPERVQRVVISAAPPRMDDAHAAAVAEVQRRFAETVAVGAARLAAAERANAALRTDIDADERRRQMQLLMARYVVRLGDAETAYLERLCAAPMNWAPVEPMYGDARRVGPAPRRGRRHRADARGRRRA